MVHPQLAATWQHLSPGNCLSQAQEALKMTAGNQWLPAIGCLS